MLQRGFVKHPEKDVDDALTTTRVGIDLAGGSNWCPPALRLWGMLDGLYELSTVRVGAPGGVASYVGAAHCAVVFVRRVTGGSGRCPMRW